MEESANDFIKELIDERRRRYLALTPEQRREADIERASRIIYGIWFAEDVPPRMLETYRTWFVENCEREYVQVAMERVFNTVYGEI